MSIKYDEYLSDHVDAVEKGYQWLIDRYPQIAEEMGGRDKIFDVHDMSKWGDDEYKAYDDYFYGENKSNAVLRSFDYAWLHHIHHNPHHWQYWVLINDDDGTKALDMPYPYIIEMICDWWSFSWRSGNLSEIFEWYDKHKKKMILSDDTRKIVEGILDLIREGLDEDVQ